MAILGQSTVNGMTFGRDSGGNATSNTLGTSAGGSGNHKTSFGYIAGNTSSNVKNSFVGARAGQGMSGFYNVGIGDYAMQAAGAVCKTSAVGQKALCSGGSGRDVIAIGSFAGAGNANRVQNAFIGVNAGRCNTADNHTAIGVDAGCSTSGTENTAIGFAALRANTSGIRNMAIGFRAICASNADWRIGIGSYSTPSATCGHISWGSSSNNTCNCIYGGWSYGSDGRDKTNVQNLRPSLGLEFIKRLRPVTYVWDNRDNYVQECGFEYGTTDGTLAQTRKHYGVIAQEVKQVLTDLNETFEGLLYDEKKDAYRMQYGTLIGPLTKAIKELDERTQQLKAQVGL